MRSNSSIRWEDTPYGQLVTRSLDGHPTGATAVADVIAELATRRRPWTA